MMNFINNSHVHVYNNNKYILYSARSIKIALRCSIYMYNHAVKLKSSMRFHSHARTHVGFQVDKRAVPWCPVWKLGTLLSITALFAWGGGDIFFS